MQRVEIHIKGGRLETEPAAVIYTYAVKSGFTLVELMIVVAILGILTAIAMPTFQGHVQKAKEAAAKTNLQLLRETIERYAAEHNGVPPGYLHDIPSNPPSGILAIVHFQSGYLIKVPDNPFNNLMSIKTVANGGTIPLVPDNKTGWIYKPSTKTIKLNYPGTDSEGRAYYDY